MKQKFDHSIHQEIANKVHAGEYYKDALNWYSIRYLSPLVQRIYLVLITVISVVTAIVSIRIFLSFLPLVETVPIAITIDSRAHSFSQFRYIGDKNENPNISVVKFMAKRYIEYFEEYDFAKLERNLNFVKNYSSEEIFSQYTEIMSISNPESRVLKFRKHTKRFIDITHLLVERVNADLGTWKVTTKFQVTEKAPTGITEENWKAEIDISFSDVVFLKELGKFSPMDLKITRYNAIQVGEGS